MESNRHEKSLCRRKPMTPADLRPAVTSPLTSDCDVTTDCDVTADISDSAERPPGRPSFVGGGPPLSGDQLLVQFRLAGPDSVPIG